MQRKIHIDAPSLVELHTSVELDPRDGRDGLWTRLELIEMDERFCAAMRKAHPELIELELVEPEPAA